MSKQTLNRARYGVLTLANIQQFHVIRGFIQGVFGVNPGIPETKIFLDHIQKLVRDQDQMDGTVFDFDPDIIA